MSTGDLWTVVAVFVGVLLTAVCGIIGALTSRAFDELAGTVREMDRHTETLRIDAATTALRLTNIEADIADLQHRLRKP